MAIQICTPFTDNAIKELEVGQMVEITGTLYVGRDTAHKMLVEMLENGEKLPFDFKGQGIYYAGPAPNKPGQPIGSIGPTTSGRMDAYSPVLIKNDLKVMIGKGYRNDTVVDAIKKHGGIYFAAIGGAAALISKSITAAEVVAFDDLGPEAIRKLTVEKFPAIVAIDSKGNDIYRK